jgi:hypothetical protein
MGDCVSWRFVNAAVPGTSHVRGGIPCQDDCFVDVFFDDVLVAVVSDGAGSAICAEEGAGLVCEAFLAGAEMWLRNGGTVRELTRETAEQWIRVIRAAIESRSEQKELTPRDFACTLVATITTNDACVFLQVGDGAVIMGTADDYEVIFWPDGGEYANMTYFVTDDDWAQHLHFEVRASTCDDLALMTDGLQRLALHFESRTAHVPFFIPMFRALERVAPGFAFDLEPALVAFLGSDAVNERTDDDKSLVLATRRSGVAPGTD